MKGKLEFVGWQDRVYYKPVGGDYKWSRWQDVRLKSLSYRLEDEYGADNVQTREVYAEKFDNSPPK